MTCVRSVKTAQVHMLLAPLMDILDECKMIILAVPFLCLRTLQARGEHTQARAHTQYILYM